MDNLVVSVAGGGVSPTFTPDPTATFTPVPATSTPTLPPTATSTPPPTQTAGPGPVAVVPTLSWPMLALLGLALAFAANFFLRRF